MIVNAENFTCPDCGKIWEEELIEACQEPFNGIIVECCDKEFDIAVCFKVEEI